MYVEDVMSRYNQVFEPAKKSEKLDHVRMMNDDFITGRLKVQLGSQYAMELSALPKDPDWDADSGKPPGEDPRFPNHLCDSALYSWRWAFAHLDYEPNQHVETEEERIERLDEERLSIKEDPDEWWDQETDGID
jgi:hypothetical protein